MRCTLFASARGKIHPERSILTIQPDASNRFQLCFIANPCSLWCKHYRHASVIHGGHSCNRTLNISDLTLDSRDIVLSRVRENILTMMLQEFAAGRLELYLALGFSDLMLVCVIKWTSALEGFPGTRMSIEADGVVVAGGVVAAPAAVSRVAILWFTACSAVPACCRDRSNRSSRSSDVPIVTRFQSNKPTP